MPDRNATASGRALSRRNLLGATGLGAAAVLAGTDAASAAPAATQRRHGTRVAVPHDPALHAIRRLGYGPTPKDLAALRSAGVHRWLDAQLGSLPDPHENALLLSFPFLNKDALTTSALYAEDSWTAVQTYEWATLSRSIYSTRQVQTRLTEMWLDHFNVCSLSSKEFLPWTRFEYDTEVIRPRAAGTFVELLRAVLTSPAMLTYLDQWVSDKHIPAENLARENLELHTLGVGHFTERDVKAYAKLLTGLTINGRTWKFDYDPAMHYTGALEIVGFKAHNRRANALGLVMDFAEYLAHRPQTAHTVAKRLLVEFVDDHPPKALIERVARHYLRSGTHIGSTLKFIVEQDAFFASRGRKARRPSDWFAAAVRGLGWQWAPGLIVGGLGASVIDSWSRYPYLLRAAGDVPSEWPAPNGYPEANAAWQNSNTMLQTWNLMAQLATVGDSSPFDKTGGPAAEVWRMGMTLDQVIAKAAEQIIGQSMPAVHRHAIAEMVGLAPSYRPTFNWRTGSRPAHQLIHFGIASSEYMELR